MQSMESFNFIKYNVEEMGEDKKHGGAITIVDNNNAHYMQGDLGDGSIMIRALASSPDKQDSLNANLCICDEIHAFKQPKQYNLFKECQKAYTNKLLIGISTAGDNENAFLGQRLKYCRNVLEGTVKDEQYFILFAVQILMTMEMLTSRILLCMKWPILLMEYLFVRQIL